MDAVREAFDAAAKGLILGYRVRASELEEHVHNIEETACKGLPPLQVLYNDISGPGYRYSAEFKRFILAKKATPESLVTLCALQSEATPGSGSESSFSRVSNDDRIRHAQRISSFGRFVMEKWPRITKLVNAYMRNYLGHRIRDIEMIARKQDRLRKSLNLSDAIASAIAAQTGRPDNDGRTKYDLLYLSESNLFHNSTSFLMHRLGQYAPSALKAMRTELDAKQSELIQDVQKGCDAVLMHMTKPQYEAMLQSLDTKLVGEKVKDTTDGSTSNEHSAENPDEEFSNEDSNKHPDEHFSDKNLSFTCAIVKYGEHHDAVWKFQNFKTFKTSSTRRRCDSCFCIRSIRSNLHHNRESLWTAHRSLAYVLLAVIAAS